MSVSFVPRSKKLAVRWVAGVSGVVLAAVGVAVAAAPAVAADVDIEVANAQAYQDAIELCEGGALSEGDTCTIMVTASFEFDYAVNGATPTYTGVANLSIVGAEGVEVSVADSSSSVKFIAFYPTGEDPATLRVEALSLSGFGGNDMNGGGAIGAQDADVVIHDVHFSDNYITDFGGAVYVNNSSLSISDSTFEFNGSGTGGGAVAVWSDNNPNVVEITGSLFRHNFTGDVGGGAVVVRDMALTIDNSTFSNNDVYDGGPGGAVRVTEPSGSLDVTHATFVGNSATSGAHLSLYSGNSGTLDLTATVLANGSGSPACHFTTGNSGGPSGGYNWSEDDSCWDTSAMGDTEFGDDARLGNLVYKGGPTQVVALDPGSELFNAVPLAECELAVDQRGAARPQGDGCDIGAFEYGPGPFPDVTVDHPFVLEIEWLADREISGGYGDGTFRPTGVVTRQAMAAFLYRYSNANFEPSGAPTFPDVPETHPFYTEIEWLASQEVTGGYGDGTFRPTGEVTRQAMAAFMYRLLDADYFIPPATATFPDVPTSHPFFDEIEWLAEVEVTTGYTDGTFRPSSSVSRMAMAAFLARLNELPQ